MKRISHLFERIAAVPNLYAAFYRCRKGRKRTAEITKYQNGLGNNLHRLLDSLLNGTYKPGLYRYFTIYEPKERHICAACFEDGIVHHAVMNIIGPIFDRSLIYDTYACRENKGTHAALYRAFHFCKHERYFMKLDIRKYFDSMDHSVLIDLLERKIKDRELIELLKIIIGSYQTAAGKGVPIGNLTSQHFANVYLSPIDHYIKQDLKYRGYVRYMDDSVLWSNSKDHLKRAYYLLQEILNGKFKLQVKEPYINSVENGLPFLQYRITGRGIFLTNKKKKRFIVKYRELRYLYRSDIINNLNYAQRLETLFRHIDIARSRYFRNNVLQRIEP